MVKIKFEASDGTLFDDLASAQNYDAEHKKSGPLFYDVDGCKTDKDNEAHFAAFYDKQSFNDFYEKNSGDDWSHVEDEIKDFDYLIELNDHNCFAILWDPFFERWTYFDYGNLKAMYDLAAKVHVETGIE